MVTKLNNNRGMTLIEMLIVIAILGLVSTMVGSFFGVSEVVFREGQDQTVEQHAVRLTADIIAKEIRNASDIGLFPDATALTGFDEYFYIENQQLVKEVLGTKTLRTQQDLASDSDIPPGLDFDLIGGGNVYFLEFTVVGSDKFEVSTKVLLNNIDNSAVNDLLITVPSSGAVVGVTKP